MTWQLKSAAFKESTECAGAGGTRNGGGKERGRILTGSVPDGGARQTTRKKGKAGSSARTMRKGKSTQTTRSPSEKSEENSNEFVK
jgi:hypothetical protein